MYYTMYSIIDYQIEEQDKFFLSSIKNFILHLLIYVVTL